MLVVVRFSGLGYTRELEENQFGDVLPWVQGEHEGGQVRCHCQEGSIVGRLVLTLAGKTSLQDGALPNPCSRTTWRTGTP